MKSALTINDIMRRTGVQFGTSGIRGLVDALTDESCFAYAYAFLEHIAPVAECLVIGHDLRPSSPRIAAACAAAAERRGCRVMYAGVLPTPALAWYAQERSIPAIMVTGSHIPFDRNGLKFYRADGEISKADEQAILAALVVGESGDTTSALPVQDTSIVGSYAQRYLQAFGHQSLHGLRVGFYQHSSSGRDVISDILCQLGVEVVPLMRTDYFVPIDTEAVSEEDQALALKWAGVGRFDALISTDGDADRPLISDEHGNWLRGDVVGILCAQALGIAQVVAPVSCISSIEACNSFSTVLRTRIGSPYVIEGMERLHEVDGPLAGFEANGGFLLGSPVAVGGAPIKALPTRDALLPILALLRFSLLSGKKISALTAALPERFSASDRIAGFDTVRSAALVAAMKGDSALALGIMLPDAKSIASTNTVDGFRAQFEGGDIVHVRPSGNAPEFRCIAESSTALRARELCQQCLQRIASLPPEFWSGLGCA